MKVLVLYNSRHGHTRKTADAIAQAVRDQDHEAVIKSVMEVSRTDIGAADAVLIGTWVQGLILFAVKPAGAELWATSLPALDGKPVGVFCTYAFHPQGSLRALSDLLERRGAVIAGQRAFHRSRPGRGAESFVRDVLQQAAGRLS